MDRVGATKRAMALDRLFRPAQFRDGDRVHARSQPRSTRTGYSTIRNRAWKVPLWSSTRIQ